MKIKLTRVQWEKLAPIVSQGKLAKLRLGLPVEITNGDQKIEISETEVKITLEG